MIRSIGKTITLGLALIVASGLAAILAAGQGPAAGMRVLAWLLTLLFLATSGALGWFFVRSVRKAVGSLQEGVDRIASGDQAHPVRVEGGDELAALSRRLDAMADRVAAATVPREEWLKAQAALTERGAALTRCNSEMDQFASVLSHDLQEPLRIVTGYVRLLESQYRGRLDSDADELIGCAIDGVNRMQRLINDLLLYSRVGTRTKAFVEVDCNMVAARALLNCSAALRDSGARVTQEHLPMVRGDEAQLGQLFQQLVGNAVKFRGPRPLEIHLGCERRDSCWRFSVRDNGIGIDPADFERIFVIFQRLHTKQEYPGTGIGLAACKRIVERHGGRIWAESEPGHGATFCFSLPVAAVAEADSAPG